MKNMKLALAIGITAVTLSGGACTNSKFGFANLSLVGTSPSPSASPSTGTFMISTITIASSSSAASSTAPTTTIYFDTSQSKGQISTFCNGATSSSSSSASLPCSCQFSWQEINQATGTSIPIPRQVQTTVTTVQPNVVICSAPDVYNSEIGVGTTVTITVLSGTASSSTFSVTPYNYVKGNTTTTGSFQDSQGHSFDNILHYSCFEQFTRGMTITNKTATATNSQSGETAKVYIASQFCVAKGSTVSADQNCASMPAPDYSAQANYYNLYIRNSETGDINSSNSRYVCPQVKESLNGNGTVGTSGQYWPLDSSFALSLGSSATFNVGVNAFTKISKAGDPVSANSASCGATGSNTATTQTSNSTLTQSCLGFAMSPNTDGTCPSFADSTGATRFTFRLRRYIALYPPVFDTNGAPLNNGQLTDNIYVLDRPVYSSVADPKKPYTMRGPKPCPFAYFDHKAVTGSGSPVYAATNAAGWANTNVDGIHFPNFDSINSCSAVMPVFNSDNTVLTLATIHATNPIKAFQNVYVRPVQPWAPHYEEDTSFQACAPQAYPMNDAPLHFAKNSTTGNIGWCTEAYPTQNDNISSLDPPSSPGQILSGNVTPFTSHTVKNSASPTCTATIPSSVTALGGLYPGGGAGKHVGVLTCDRTVVSQGLTWPLFPLLAQATQVESAVTNDSSYGCTVSYDGGGSKTGKYSPASGCCGANVSMKTGIPTAGDNTSQVLNAHLEPGTSCTEPTY